MFVGRVCGMHVTQLVRVEVGLLLCSAQPLVSLTIQRFMCPEGLYAAVGNGMGCGNTPGGRDKCNVRG